MKALLNHNAKVYIAARNPQKAEDAIADLKKETGKEALFIKLDLADLKSVKAAAEDYTRCVLFLSLAGTGCTYVHPRRRLTDLLLRFYEAKRRNSTSCSTLAA